MKEQEPKISHEEHLEIMIGKFTEEIASCQKCGCPSCKRNITSWEEKIIGAMEELEFYENG